MAVNTENMHSIVNFFFKSLILALEYHVIPVQEVLMGLQEVSEVLQGDMHIRKIPGSLSSVGLRGVLGGPAGVRSFKGGTWHACN